MKIKVNGKTYAEEEFREFAVNTFETVQPCMNTEDMVDELEDFGVKEIEVI